ncbi:ATPase RavA domain-containing protein [Pseudaeromonas paramecii]|uniref:ATPase RavA n=1 Tax=Pseudaeromonas paramecii TaxID=2138166 RepID=A0ABP8QCA5_9GAMM
MSVNPLPDRIGRLLDALAQGLYERKDVVRLCLLAALAGESVFMLGPPGIAKSLIARRLIHAFDQSRAFEYLMTRFSTPDEVFGPLSIQALKDEGKYERLTQGYLPEAEVVFLDEIWKAGPAILNTLLTVINERRYRNGVREVAVPMRLLVAASNELPQADSGLEALYDRLLFRVWLDRIQEKQNFRAMLTSRQDPQADPVDAKLKISQDEYQQWQQALTQVALPDSVFEQLYRFREQLAQLVGDGQTEGVYVSDRRWKKAVRLLQASAFFNGRSQIGGLDLLLLKDCLWHDLSSKEQVNKLMLEFARRQAFGQDKIQFSLQRLHNDLERLQRDWVRELACKLTPARRWRPGKEQSWRLDAKQLGLKELPLTLRLLFLQPCCLDNAQPDRPTLWAEVDSQQWQQWQRKGGPIRARFNEREQRSSLLLDVDSEGRLIARDERHQAILVALPKAEGVPGWLRQRQTEQLDELLQALGQQQQALLNQRRSFAAQCPHLFLEQSWLRQVEESLLALVEQAETLQQQLQQQRQELLSLTQEVAHA